MGKFGRDNDFGGGGGGFKSDRGGKRFGGRDSFSSRGPGGGGGFRGGSERPPMFKATCDSCGQSCEVPFRPTGEKPVYCRACFVKNGGGNKFGRDDRRETGPRDFGDSRKSSFGADKPMFPTTCAECGMKCEVPFRPSEDKPAYCRNCYAAKGGPRGPRPAVAGMRAGGSGLADDPYRAQFAAIHEKLDLILDALYEDMDEIDTAPAAKETKAPVKNDKKSDKANAAVSVPASNKPAETVQPKASVPSAQPTATVAASVAPDSGKKAAGKKPAKNDSGKKSAEKPVTAKSAVATADKKAAGKKAPTKGKKK